MAVSVMTSVNERMNVVEEMKIVVAIKVLIDDYDENYFAVTNHDVENRDVEIRDVEIRDIEIRDVEKTQRRMHWIVDWRMGFYPQELEA